MVTTPRVPPRFVPTLTEVVQGGDTPAPQSAPAPRPLAPAPTAAAPVARAPTAPSALAVHPGPSAPQGAAPTLAPVPVPVPSPAVSAPRATVPVASDSAALVQAPPVGVPPPAQQPATRALLSEDFEELIVHRVMQRVDVSLDRRLRDAIASVVLEQTRSILPRLREEVESVVRDAVYEAVADELAAKPNQ